MFKTGELVFIGIMGAITFGVGFALGVALNVATGTPMVGGLLNAIITAALIAITVKTIKRFGVGVILWVVMSALAIPTMTMGPPGAHKLLVGILGGIVLDSMLVVTRRKNWGYLVAGGTMSLAVMLGVFAVAIYFDFPAAEKLRKYIVYLIPINFVLGLTGTQIGIILFDKRLHKLPFIKNLQRI